MSNADSSGFGPFVPGFEFMQNLAKQAAGGLAQGAQPSVPHMPSLGNWVAPTFNVEDLEKRIEELKAVHFWLDQNSRALAATIQALEVQKMTLSTLQGMNLSLGDVANAVKIKTADVLSSMTGMAAKAFETPQPSPQPALQPEAPAATPTADASPAAAGGVIDPMQWWGALSQQFQTIATNAMADASRQTALNAGMARELADSVVAKPATGSVTKAAKAAKPTQATPGKAAGKPLAKNTTQGAAKSVKVSPRVVSKPKVASAPVKAAAVRRPASGKPAGRAR